MCSWNYNKQYVGETSICHFDELLQLNISLCGALSQGAKITHSGRRFWFYHASHRWAVSSIMDTDARLDFYWLCTNIRHCHAQVKYS